VKVNDVAEVMRSDCDNPVSLAEVNSGADTGPAEYVMTTLEADDELVEFVTDVAPPTTKFEPALPPKPLHSPPSLLVPPPFPPKSPPPPPPPPPPSLELEQAFPALPVPPVFPDALKEPVVPLGAFDTLFAPPPPPAPAAMN
jgi:hypothetical protein